MAGLILPLAPFCAHSAERTRETYRVLGGFRCSAESRKARNSPKRKDNYWSLDLHQENNIVFQRQRSNRKQNRSKKKQQESGGHDEKISPMLIVDEVQILQPEELVTSPLWTTFLSSNRGVWKGVGAVFSPDTAEMQPIGLGRSSEYLYDCRIVNFVDTDDERGILKREVFWNLENPHGGREVRLQNEVLEQDIAKEGYQDKDEDDDLLNAEQGAAADQVTEDEPVKTSKRVYPGMEEVMERDTMPLEEGLLYFEDGSYSRGPLDLLSGSDDEKLPAAYHTPLFKIEQCLVRGGHTRARIVHTVAVDGDNEEFQVVRLAVYEEEWASPIQAEGLSDCCGSDLEVELLSQRQRSRALQLTGTWKVFEVNACVEDVSKQGVYGCMEYSVRRELPDADGDEGDDGDGADMLWLPGGYFAYAHVDEGEAMLCLGAGWLRDVTCLVMERCYSLEGQLLQVSSKAEVKMR